MRAGPHILQIPPYRPELPYGDLIRMASNENCYGPSPRAIEAMRRVLCEVNRYANEGGYLLREAIGRKLRAPASRVIIGNGSTEIVELIARTYLQPESNAVTADQTFLMYRIAVAATGAACRQVPAKDFAYDLSRMMDAIDQNTRVIYIANPNNPTGLYIRKVDLDSFVEAVPSNVIVALDEAYCEYVEEEEYPDGLAYLDRFPNVVVLRTFSKVHSLAGLRIGYAITSEEILSEINRIRAPYNTNSVAQAAALAALDDLEHVRGSRKNNRQERAYLENELRILNVRFLRSVTNFILLILVNAADVAALLQENGIFVRAMQKFNVRDGLRVTIGTHQENVAFVEALRNIL